jgi:hypothetical protein
MWPGFEEAGRRRQRQKIGSVYEGSFYGPSTLNARVMAVSFSLKSTGMVYGRQCMKSSCFTGALLVKSTKKSESFICRSCRLSAFVAAVAYISNWLL